MGARDELNNALTADSNEERYSIIRNREVLNDGYQSTGPPGMPSYGESSDDYYGVVSDSDIVINERYKNDAKLRKRCAVVITPTKELLQYERKRDEMYNEILLKQRRKLELRALEKQREKERRRLGRREEKSNDKKITESIDKDRDKTPRRKTKNYNEIFMSSESEYETNFQVRTLKQRQQNVKDLQPLNIQIEMTEATTTSLLNQIDAHLDQPETEKSIVDKKGKQQDKQRTHEKEKDDSKQQTCDISQNKGQTKMRELNLLADIAQHLSPYQLDIPETNTNPPALQTPLETKVAKEKVTVTEHVIIQSFDNLLEKTQTQLDFNDQQQQPATSTPNYAHEPKLNTAAILNTSPTANLLQQQNNTPHNDSTTASNEETREVAKSKLQTTETLEQILEESISVLKSVTSPFNSPNQCTPSSAPVPAQTPHSKPTIPLMISNVESLNHFKQNDENDKTKQKSDVIEHLLPKESTSENSENAVILENGQENEENKDVIEDLAENVNDTESSTILNTIESSIICAADLSNISTENEISHALKVPALMPADLSDISLESEISKHLPDIAEPSPVVTDMSENSNESQVSKHFGLHLHNINNNISTPETAVAAGDMSLPVLPLDMPNISPPPPPPTALTSNQDHAIEKSFSQLDCSLNTPIKLATMSREEEGHITNHPPNDLNTPLRFAIQPQLEDDNTPLKNALEPDTDNNVTKFLDLILNKTVTDAESEARDKIIKELNALTADTTETASALNETNSNDEVTIPMVTELNENKTLKSADANGEVLECKSQEAENDAKETQHISLKDFGTEETLENSEKDSSGAENLVRASSSKEENVLQPSERLSASEHNEELNPPKEIPKETKTPTELSSEATTASKTTTCLSPPPSTMKTSPIKQTFNIKCRVRLKRLNIHKHRKNSKKETWVAIPLTKPEEESDQNANNSDKTNCDTKTDSMTSFIKKPCLKYNNNKRASGDEQEHKSKDSAIGFAASAPLAADVASSTKKLKLENEPTTEIETALIPATQQPQISAPVTLTPPATPALTLNSTAPPKSKTKSLKTVTFDLSNLNEELRETTTYNHKQKSKNHAANIALGASGFYLKNSRPPRKLPDNTLRAAETLQLFVNTINDSTRTPPPAEFNKKRSPIKNKCIAEDETPRPPPASTLMGTPPCKKICNEKSRSQITTSSKCKDQLVSSLPTPSISNITSDINTARIYTSSPLDQTLPEYDDNVDTVADSELILPNTTGSLRRKLKRPKKSLTRPEPADDISTDDISNQPPECNGEDDTDAVVDNEDDVFAEELLPIPAANEHILEEIVSARPTHMGTGTVIRDDYMNIEATATVPVYLFNDESRDLATPEPIQSSDTTNVVDSSSYLNTSSTSAAHNALQATAASTTSTSAQGSLEKSMLSPSEHEVSSTQETFYQTPTKSKQTGDAFGEKSTTSKDKPASVSIDSKQKPEDKNFQNKEDDQTSSTTGLLQNNQVDTTNHSPEMCTLVLTPTTSSNTTSNRKIRKASTHDEILFNELQQQQQQQLVQNKRKTNTTTTTFCAESTSDNNNDNTASKSKEDAKSNGSLAKDEKFKKLLKEACKRDKNSQPNELEMGVIATGNIGAGGGGGGGGSSPSTTTIINEEKLSRSKRKKQKSSKSSKTKNHSEERKIVLKASKLAAHMPAPNDLKITIPISRLSRSSPTPTPPTPTESQNEKKQTEFLDIPNAKLFIEKETITTVKNNNSQHQHQLQHHHQQNHTPAHSVTKKEWHQAPIAVTSKTKRSHSPVNTMSEIVNIKLSSIAKSETKEVSRNTNSTTTTTTPKEKTSSTSTTKKKIKTSNNTSSANNSTTCSNFKNNSNNNLIFVKDKYDLIKSKDKHHHDLQESKEKVKDKTSSSHTKAISSANTRVHKSSSKEKVKEKHKANEKSASQTENVSKVSISQSSNKGLNFLISPSSSSSSTSNNVKQSNSKSNKSNSNSSPFPLSAPSLGTTAILKSKTNLSTQALTIANPVAVSQTSNATSSSASASASSSPSVTIPTNHVRKKLKTK